MNGTSGKLARMRMHAALLAFAAAAIACSGAAFAQAGGGMLQQKLQESIKASAAANQQKLHRYTWTETAVVTVNGHEMAPKVSTCSYGPDGKVHKVPVEGGATTAAAGRRGGPLMQRMMKEKKAETKDYAAQVGHLIALYVPPNPQKMGEAFKEKKVSFSRSGGDADLVFRNYALKGDAMTLAIDQGSHRIHAIDVKSWLDTPQDPVTLKVDFGTLPDGTTHPSRTTLDAAGKGLHVVTTNSNYRKSG